MESEERYFKVGNKATEIETALRRIGRWQHEAMAPEKYENPGAFGVNTMSFEQWIQFVLLVRTRSIIADRGDFPETSSVGAYAVRERDGDDEASELIRVLSEFDELIESTTSNDMTSLNTPVLAYNENDPRSILTGTENLPLPHVVYQLAELFPILEGDALETQLQTFDTFLSFTDQKGRAVIIQMLQTAAEKGRTAKERLRLQKAAASVSAGGRAAPPYDHTAAMKKYQEEFRKNFLK
jgi:uncharacterized protein YqcC (DUF446 family)